MGVAEPYERRQNKHWPEGWWGVWDENGGFIAYFQYEEDAFAFRLLLITIRQSGKEIAVRYKVK